MVPKQSVMATNFEEEEDDGRTTRRDRATARAPSESPAPVTRPPSIASVGMSDAGLQASQGSMLSEGGMQRRTRPRALDYGTIQTSFTGHVPQVPSPQVHGQAQQSIPRTPQRPSAKRQTSAAPHRGQAFSVDDDPREVDRDLQLARTQTRNQTPSQTRDRELSKRQSTLRRRPTAQAPQLRTVESEDAVQRSGSVAVSGNDAAGLGAQLPQADGGGESSAEGTVQAEEQAVEEEEEWQEPEEPASFEDEDEEHEEDDDDDDEDEHDGSDAESFTLKDRQQAINETHPFGIRIWKPALYKKSRSVQRNAEGDIHSTPGGFVSWWLFLFNCLWTVLFGWWLSLLAGMGGILNLLLAKAFGIQSCHDYGRVLLNLSHYLFYPFGKFIKLERDEAYADEDEGEGRSISEYERWQTGDLEQGRLFFGPTDINRSIIGRRRDSISDHNPPPDETSSLLGGRAGRSSPDAADDTSSPARPRTKKRLFGRGEWNLGRIIFFLSFYFLLTPCLFLVSGLCWFLVVTIPMGKVTLLLFYHLRRHPLALSFHTDSHSGRKPSMGANGRQGHSILLCTYRAVGWKYWKYTIDGTNIFLINLLGLVVFAIFDYFVLFELLGVRSWLTNPGLMFVLGLGSIIPLAYFIGQAVASISAQSSMGVGATINAFFSTVVEVFLYCVALQQGKAQLVEGSIIGSIFAGILFLPGLSMCFGALKRKTQRFNVKSAGVTSTMLLFAVIGAFCPTLFYEIYGSHELNCHQCLSEDPPGSGDRDCRRCYFAQVPAVHDRFFIDAVKPYIWICAACLFLSYVVGLLFTLRTHASVIWNNEPDEERKKVAGKKDGEEPQRHASIVPGSAGLVMQETPGSSGVGGGRPHMMRGETAGTTGSLARENIRESQMYKRILNQSLKQAWINTHWATPPPPGAKKDFAVAVEDLAEGGRQTPHLVPPKSSGGDAETASLKSVRIQGLSAEDNRVLVQQVAEMAATAATVAARDATKMPRKSALVSGSGSSIKHHGGGKDISSKGGDAGELPAVAVEGVAGHEEPGEGGHDAPNWSRTKSAVILLTATLAYAVIAEILVDTVDAVLTNVDVSEKFLGITLFALVPNTTEFLNAISFAMHGNVALSMEIGSSYALQVMLLQIPCLVLFSEVYSQYIDVDDVVDHTFTLIFPQWDMVTVILGVFLMGWVVGEGKSNYFKGSTLIFTYLVVTVGFWFSGYVEPGVVSGAGRFGEGAAVHGESFWTVGRGGRGRAW
ncbi:hypothetical protein LTR08_002748 [Meristemomyces frigidus]|nr:hypothetical protein LTR08_002748 [Meristemomyces frigidus]